MAKETLSQLAEQIEALVAEEKIPHGLGALTVALLDGEVCDWQGSALTPQRCAPQVQWAAGTARRRLLRWQPGWHARVKYLRKLKHCASLKKKTVVALARQLAIDLWRWRTGRCIAAELGWTLGAKAEVESQR